MTLDQLYKTVTEFFDTHDIPDPPTLTLTWDALTPRVDCHLDGPPGQTPFTGWEEKSHEYGRYTVTRVEFRGVKFTLFAQPEMEVAS